MENSPRSSVPGIRIDEGLVAEELGIKLEDISIEEGIGEGSFGKVMRGNYFGTSVAVKKLFNHDDRKMQKYIQREMATLKNIRHPNIVQFLGLIIHTSGVYIVTEYVPGGDLTVYIDNFQLKFTWRMIVKIITQVAQAMAFLHAKNILHRDLKCSNLLIVDSHSWGIKICDFGMARKTSSSSKFSAMTICGTDEYMAPEILMGEAYNAQADVFSFGLIMAEVLTRRVPANRDMKTRFSFNSADFERNCPPNVNTSYVNLLKECCQTDPSKRPSFMLILDVLNLMSNVSDDPIVFTDAASVKAPTTAPSRKTRTTFDSHMLEAKLKEIDSGKADIKKPMDRRNTVVSQAPVKNSYSEDRRNTVGSEKEFMDMDVVKQLREMCSQGNSKALKDLLSKNPKMELDLPDVNGETPLFLALKYSHTEIVDTLVKNRASVNIQDRMKNYPIHLACRNSNVKIVLMLLNAQAKIKVMDGKKNYPVHIACEVGNMDLLKLIIDKGGKTVLELCNEQGETPLLICCRLGYDPLVSWLVESGANVDVIDKQKRTPLWNLSRLGRVDVARILIGSKSPMDTVSEDGTTPLIQAGKDGHLDFAIMLVKSGVDISKYHKHSVGPTTEYRNALFEAAGLDVVKIPRSPQRSLTNSSSGSASSSPPSFSSSSKSFTKEKTK